MTESARLVIAVDSRQVGQADSALSSLGRTSSTAATAVKSVAAAFGVRELYQATEAYASIANRMRLVTESAVELRAAQDAVFQSAQTARQPLAATAELYQRIAANQKALNLSGKGVASITDTISKSLAISGASAASANAALIQLGQAFASGTLRGEELNSVMEQAPALSQAIAAGMGVTIGQLRSLGAEGKLTAEAVVKALQDQADAVDDKFSKIANTIGGALQVAGNTLTRLVGELDQASGATTALAGGIIDASKFIDKFTEGSEALSTSITAVGTAMTIAAGRVAGGFAQQGAAALYAANANRVALNAAAATAKQDLISAQSKQVDARATLEVMTLNLSAAEAKVASDRVVMASEVSRIKMVQSALASEMALEQQRMKSQISEAGRTATVARMVEIRGAQVLINKQVEASERTLAATTVASSAQVQAAYAKVAAAKVGVGETTAVVNAAVVASDRATAAASTFAGAGKAVLGLLGGPLGLVFTVGAVAASYFMFRDGANEATSALIDQNGTLDDSIQKFKELSAEQQRFQSSKWVEAQESALDSASSALAEYATRGSQAFNSLGMSGVESAEAFNKMVEEVKAGTRSLDSVTEWVAKNNQIMPAFKSMLEQTAAAYSANGEKAEKYGKLLAQSSGVTTSATTETEKLAAAQKAAAESSGAKAGEWDKYIAKLTETRDLLGANAAAEAEYNAAKMGANAQQVAQAKLIGEQTVVLKAYQEAVKDGNKVEQAALKTKLLGLYTAEEAATQAAATQKQAYADTATAAESSAKRQITAIEQAANFAIASAARMASGASAQNPVVTGYSLITNGGTAPAIVPEVKETALERVDRAIKLINEGTEANKKTDKAANAAAKAIENQAKALKDFEAQSAISTKSSNDMADAYLSGADNVRELTIQQKIEEELLKTGAGARDAVTAAVNREADAKDRLDINQYIANLRVENASTVAQAAATLQGRDALESFNITKAMTIALSGKKIATDSVEYKQLLEQTKAQLDANKALEQAGKVESIVERLDPQVKLLRDYTEEQEALNAAIAQGTDKTPLYQDALAKLGLEYEQNKASATAWGKFTEGAVDRVDDAFADAWKNIDKGFKGFADSLKDGFKQLLAELAHMAITKPIIMQIGASLGVGGLSAQSSGLFGGSSGGGTDILSLAKGANQLYSVANSGFGQAISSGWASGDGLFGGLQNAFSGGYGYVGSALGFGSGAAGAAASSGIAQGAAAYGSQFGTGIGTVSFPGAASGAAGGAASGAASAGLSGLGAAGYGIGGAIAGYQQAGVKGAVTGAGGAVAGAYAGAAIGSVVPIIGTAIGTAIGAVLGGMLGSSVWGGDWVTKDQGIQLGVTDNQFVGKQFEYQKKKGGLFSSNKKRTRLSALDPEMQAALDSTYDATKGSVLSLFDRLNVELNDGVLDGLNVASTKISTKDKTAEQIQEEIAKWFGGVADSMVSAVDAATNSGLQNYNFEALTKFVNNLYSVNDSFEMLGRKLYDVSVSTGFMAEQLVAMAGGAEAFNAANSKFFDSFYTDVEKTNYTLATVTKQFKAMDVALPGSRAAFRSVVDALDLTTESGRKMYVTLTSLAGSAAQAYTILERQLMSAATNAQGAVQRAISAQQKKATEAYNATNTSLNDMVSTVTENVSGLTAVGNDLSAALKALRGDSDDAVKMLRAQAQATLQSALATARSGKSLSGFTGLEDALDTVSNNNTDLYGSMEDFARDQGRTANVVAELNAINGKQLTSAEASLAGLKTQIDLAKAAYDAQMAQYDQQLEFAQAQMDALNGVDNSVMGVTAAINAMNAAVVAALGTIGGKASAATPQNNATAVESIYQSVLKRGTKGDEAGAAFWAAQLQSGALGYEQIAAAIAQGAVGNSAESAATKANAGKFLGLPGYATGGLINGPGTGTSDSIFARLSNGEYVMSADAVRMFGTGVLDQMNAGLIPAFATGGGIGETGPQLEVTGPSRIFNANQAGSMSKGGSDNAQLERKVDVLIDVVKQIVGPMKLNSDADSKLFKKWDRVGLPTTVVKEPA
ncbi:tape measure protein [Pseudomonas lactis]|uniref:tape measure protein n=1 Tax=Pseudomonas TaxID=286 RepID=UPI000BB5F26E|nr:MULTISPECIES: tape measure protein [Pseudomonas]MBA5956235.1 tape measure protein [Pseudomonas lactis]PRW80088.1 hypothetical protein C7A12_02620 [Pseudomonas fluorescens]PRW80863.1 hypothetical protein C7A13_06495 [Pseudomonas fluorescens]